MKGKLRGKSTIWEIVNRNCPDDIDGTKNHWATTPKTDGSRSCGWGVIVGSLGRGVWTGRALATKEEEEGAHVSLSIRAKIQGPDLSARASTGDIYVDPQA